MDVNGNGILSLAEVDKGMRDILQIPEIFDMKPVMLRAFNAAKTYYKGNKKSYSDDYIQIQEYRILLKYLRQYFEYFVAFMRVDDDGDRRIDFDEFVGASDKLALWGIDMSDPEAAFAECDANGGGKILFDEFCRWAIAKNLDLEDDDNDDEDQE